MVVEMLITIGVLICIGVVLSRWQIFRAFIKDLLSIDEARISVLIFMGMSTLVFAAWMCLKYGDIPPNLNSTLQVLIISIAGVGGSFTIGSIVQKVVTQIKSGNISGAFSEMKSGIAQAESTSVTAASNTTLINNTDDSQNSAV